MAKKTAELKLTKKEIIKAVEESQKVKKEYPAFWKFHCMLMELNNGLNTLEEAFKEDEECKK